MTTSELFHPRGFLLAILALLAFSFCKGKEPPPVVVVPPVVVPVPEPPAPEPPPPVVIGPQCHPDDSLTVLRARELAAAGKSLTTYWYDSTGATTVEGVDGRGCLAGYKVND